MVAADCKSLNPTASAVAVVVPGLATTADSKPESGIDQ